MEPQRAPQARALNEARRTPSPVIDAFVLPSAAIRPGLFYYVKRGMVWLSWLGVIAVAGVIMVYPRQSLIQALTFVKLLNESFHEAFDEPPLKKNGQPPGKGSPPGTVAQNGKPGTRPTPASTSLKGSPRVGQGVAQGGGEPATGQPLVINTPTGNHQPEPPKLSVNLVVPGGAGSGQPAAVAPQPQGPAPSAIIINNNGGGSANGQPQPPAVTLTQVGESTGGGGQPPGAMIQTTTQGTPLPPTEQGGTSSERTSANSGLRRRAGGILALPPDWPRTVALRGTPTVTTLERHDGATQQFATQTEHYEFQSDSLVGADVVREMARVFEATYELNKLLPLQLHPTPEQGRPRFIARLFSKDRDYFAAGGMQGSSGTYSRDEACILVPISSMGVKLVNGRMQTERTESTETLIHEITHQMMNTWLPLIPRWYAEGSADYIAMADYVHGRFFLNQMEDRLRRYLQRRGQPGDAYPMLRPAELMTLDAKTWSNALASNTASASQNYASATLLTFYFYHLDGNGDGSGMLKYLRAIERGAPESEASATHLLRGRSMAELETDVMNAFEHRGIKVATVARGKAVAKE